MGCAQLSVAVCAVASSKPIPTSSRTIIALFSVAAPSPPAAPSAPRDSAAAFSCSGVAGYAGWEPGIIGKPENWSDDFQAIEACNSGSLDGLAVYLDLVPRGYKVSATSVTDSHAHFSGDPGINGTWMGIGSNDVADFNDEALIEAFGADRLVASRGVFLSLSVDPGSTLTNAGTVDVQAVSPSWIQVDRLVLYKDGAPSETLDGSAGQFNLSPDADAVYNIVAEGDTSMQPLSGATPWAMSGAIRVDVGGDGWTPPLPPLDFD